MLGLNLPQEKDIIDEVFNTCEEILKFQLQIARKETKQKYSNLSNIKKKESRDYFRNQTKIRFNELMKDLSIPIDQIMQLVNMEVNKIEAQPILEQQELYPLREDGKCLKLQNKFTNVIVPKKINFVKAEKNLEEIKEISFDRFQDFLNYPGFLKQINTLVLNLNSQGVGDNGMLHLCNTLKKYINLKNLQINLSNNGINQEGACQLGKAFFDLKNLQRVNINLFNNKIQQKGISGIINNLSKISSIEDLCLDIGCNSIGNKGIDELGKYIYDMRSLKKMWLGLYDNQIYQEGMNQFLKWFEKIPFCQTLQIDIRVNPISKENIKWLKDIIRQKKIVDFEIISE